MKQTLTIPETFLGVGYTKNRAGLPLEAVCVPVPRPEADQVLIRVAASSLNPLEYKLAELNFLGRTPPVILGLDLSGIVVAKGSAVRGVAVGDAVVAMAELNGDGGWVAGGGGGGYALAREFLTVPKPESLSFLSAAALPMCFLSAFASLYGTVQAVRTNGLRWIYPDRSISRPVACVFLSRLFQPCLEGWTWCVLSINLVLGVALIVTDAICSSQNHYLPVLRLSVYGSRNRLLELGVRSTQIDRFVSALWLPSQLEFTCRSKRRQWVVLIVQALDGLSRTAAHYGRCGKKVFEANHDSILEAIQLFECSELVDMEKAITGPLSIRLKSLPEFDPEGWALTLEYT